MKYKYKRYLYGSGKGPVLGSDERNKYYFPIREEEFDK
jgi:hypothetical protein